MDEYRIENHDVEYLKYYEINRGYKTSIFWLKISSKNHQNTNTKFQS